MGYAISSGSPEPGPCWRVLEEVGAVICRASDTICTSAPVPVTPWCPALDKGLKGAYLGGEAAMPQTRCLPTSKPSVHGAGFPFQSILRFFSCLGAHRRVAFVLIYLIFEMIATIFMF